MRRISSLERCRLSHPYADAAVDEQTLHLDYADMDDPTMPGRVLLKGKRAVNPMVPNLF